MENKKGTDAFLSLLGALAVNAIVVLCCYAICRVAFTLENLNLFTDLTVGRFLYMCVGGLRFDIAAFCYTNILYVVLLLLPLHLKEHKGYYTFLKILFVVINAVALLSNLMDSVYYQFVNRRATMSVFTEFADDVNVVGIIGGEFVTHWYLTLIGIAMVVALWRFYRSPKVDFPIRSFPRYYGFRLVGLVVAVVLLLAGIRSDLTFEERPLNNRNAKKYVTHSIESGIVQNTPFSIIRTIGKKPFAVPNYYANETDALAFFNPVHHNTMPDSLRAKAKPNVVFIMLEGFGAEYSGYLNGHLDGGQYKGYMPFLDSLMQQSLIFDCTLANGRRSIDMAPSVFSSIPMFVESFFTSQASTNEVTSIAAILDKQGYRTAFFHGADNGSLGFEDFARNAGFTEYYGRNEYGNDADYDGHWGIFDGPFLQYFCRTISTFRQPFCAAVFTLSSHHPFRIPKNLENKYPKGTHPMHHCVAYADDAVRQFFEAAKHQPWYHNTLFVLSADHTSIPTHDEFKNDYGRFRIPIIFYKPGDKLFAGKHKGIAQQIDVMPTVLDYIGCEEPYISFGCNLLTTPAEQTYGVNYNDGTFQYFKNGLMLQFDGSNATALYRYADDPLLKRNLLGKEPQQAQMERELKSIVQQYMDRMSNNTLVLKP